MRRMRVSFLPIVLASCGGRKEAELLASLAGSWSGTVTTDTAAVPATAEFAWDDKDELLTGLVTLQEPAPEPLRTYAVRRWDVISGEAWLDLTDVTDGTRALQLDEGVVDREYSGSAVVRYPCGESAPCGYTGAFRLAPVAGGTGPPLTFPQDTSRP